MSVTLPVQSDLRALLLSRCPLMDVRAPVEYLRGSIPGASNLPLLDDPQRQVIGLEYKQAGQAAAIALGEQLATSAVREQRLAAWSNWLAAHPDASLFCWRGGLRSQITQQWLAQAGWQVPRVAGGFKAMRRLLLDVTEEFCATVPVWVLSGATGSGKTDLLQAWPRSIDLEGLARHRGSAFGALGPQPSQIDFENALALCMLEALQHPGQPVLIEDESRLVGRLMLPLPLQETLKKAPLLVLEASLEERVARITRDYLSSREPRQELLEAQILGNLDRIRKRLGAERHQRLRADWEQALTDLLRGQGAAGFHSGILELLQHYYDPMYRHQQGRQSRPELQRGEAPVLLDWLARQLPCAAALRPAESPATANLTCSN